MTVLYITQNGITDHIGRSQVAPYILGLAKAGFPIHVLSAEKPGTDDLIRRYAAEFEAHGIAWTRVGYRNTPAVIGPALTQAAMTRAAKDIAARRRISLIHCRSFPPALIGYRLNRRHGIPYIFDFRDFYADGGLQKTKGVTRAAFAYFKKMEGRMVASAGKVVCLTNKAVDVLSGWYVQDQQRARAAFTVIPCCADFQHFDPHRVTPAMRRAAQKKAGLSDADFVLLYLGSLGPDYLLGDMLALFRQLLILKPTAKFLFVSNNGRDLVEAECRRLNIPPDKIRFIAADRDEVPDFISLADLSVIFIRPGLPKAGCSPTKLAELFALNVPVIANAGVGDLSEILSLDRNGSVAVPTLDDDAYKVALQQVLAVPGSIRSSIRAASAEFDVEEGVARYAAAYRELLSQTRMDSRGC